MSTGRIDWKDQRAFLAVLDSGSLSGAARSLMLAQPTVRRRIEALEARLGTALFTRAPNGLVPTAQALALGPHVRGMAAASEAFVRAASASPGAIGGTVRLTVSEFVGIEVLPAMLGSLRRDHPGLTIEIALSNQPADLLGQEADIAVRMTEPRQGALIARYVGAIPLRFFAHRAYAAAHGLPDSLDALAGHALIGPDRAASDLALVAGLDPAMRFAIRTDSHAGQAAAIRAGLGIGVLQLPIGAAAPDLVAVLPDFAVHQLDTWIVTHEDLRRTPRVAVVFDHLVATFRAYVGARG
ncbi:MAG: LysR family transcriptional regulator [Amaricoccus sp.]